MPGTRLSKTEKDLLQLWKNSDKFPYPILSEIHIEGNPGLRGIQKLDIKFDYPLTVICGKNGCNKTTILALAALGFHSPPGHCPINARRNQKKEEDFNYYTFSDFFYKGSTDPDITGVKITWEYGGSKEPIKIKKSSKTWMHYERRYERPVRVNEKRCGKKGRVVSVYNTITTLDRDRFDLNEQSPINSASNR